MSFQIPFGVKIPNPLPVDAYYDNDGTPYVDQDAANTAIVSDVRYQGLTVNINGVEYWYKDGVTDSHLVEKMADVRIENTSKDSDVDPGELGQLAFDDDYLYICVVAGETAGTATWKKVLLTIT